jgi:hypothetical protein
MNAGTPIEHGQVEAELRAIAVSQVVAVFGKMVWRSSLYHWRIDDGPPLLLLPAIDAVMLHRRLAKNAEAGQD